jgi:CBS domain-containing protein
MLQNQFGVDEHTSVGSFLHEMQEKKNIQYIILDSEPEGVVDIRNLALKAHNAEEKLKAIKKPLPYSESKDELDHFHILADTGERVIKTPEGYYDYLNALETVKDQSPEFLAEKVSTLAKDEIYALQEDDMIATAKNYFQKGKLNLLPVISGIEIVGEVRPVDLITSGLYLQQGRKMDLYDPKEDSPTQDLPVTNVMKSNPITIDKDSTVEQAITKMIEKKLPSLIVVEEETKLFSVISHRDIFKLMRKQEKAEQYEIEYVGNKDVEDEDFDVIRQFCERHMQKIIRQYPPYDHLKVSFKKHGDSPDDLNKRFTVSLVLSHGKHIHQVEKETLSGTSDEEHNDKKNAKGNLPLTVQQTFDALYNKLDSEKRKR